MQFISFGLAVVLGERSQACRTGPMATAPRGSQARQGHICRNPVLTALGFVLHRDVSLTYPNAHGNVPWVEDLALGTANQEFSSLQPA